MNTFLLDLLAILAVFSGVLVITAKNPVVSVLFLISVFIRVAGYLVLLGITYLGLAYLIIYVGAIAILFLFVIMMLNLRLVELIDTGQEFTKNLPLGIIIGSLFFFESSVHFPITSTIRKNSLELRGFSLFNRLNNLIFNFNRRENHIIHYAFNANLSENNFTNFLHIESIGQGLYTYASLWLVIAGIIFLLAMVGPIVLCMNRRQEDK